ncbi:MAG: hypothetical protein M3O09_05880, partial [Acidobacteriota bacterium]|nr:hypothetical protein [Acidobacteriota bacterium]
FEEMHAADRMSQDKLTEGIEGFSKALGDFENLLKKRLSELRLRRSRQQRTSKTFALEALPRRNRPWPAMTRMMTSFCIRTRDVGREILEGLSLASGDAHLSDDGEVVGRPKTKLVLCARCCTINHPSFRARCALE